MKLFTGKRKVMSDLSLYTLSSFANSKALRMKRRLQYANITGGLNDY
jgi:hypothetical protein